MSFSVPGASKICFGGTDESKGQRLLTDLETRVAAFSQTFGKVPQRQFRIEIFAFNNDQEYMEAAPRPQGEEKLNKSAYVVRGPDRDQRQLHFPTSK